MKASIFEDLSVVPGIALDPRFAGLVRLAALGYRGKRVETRGRDTTYRGPIVIVATSGEATKNNERFGHCFWRARAELVDSGLVEADVFNKATSTPGGRAVALATIVSTHELQSEDWPTAFFDVDPDERRRAWILENIWPLAPFAVRPQASLFFRVQVSEVVSGLVQHVASAFEPDAWAPAGNGLCPRCFSPDERPLGILSGSTYQLIETGHTLAGLMCQQCFAQAIPHPSQLATAHRRLALDDLPGLGARWGR